MSYRSGPIPPPINISVTNAASAPARSPPKPSPSRRGSLAAPDPWAHSPPGGETPGFSRLTLLRSPTASDNLEIHHGHARSTPRSRRSSYGESPTRRTSFAQPLHGRAQHPPAGPPFSPLSNLHTLSPLCPSLLPDKVVEFAAAAHNSALPPDPNTGRRSISIPTPTADRSSSPPPCTEFEHVKVKEQDTEILLPFADRSTEVRALLEGYQNEGLLLALARAYGHVEEVRFSSLPPWSSGSPEGWIFNELLAWLTGPGRDEFADREWVLRTRLSVRRKSAHLWEKLSLCLGVDAADFAEPEDVVEDELDFTEEFPNAFLRTDVTPPNEREVNPPSAVERAASVMATSHPHTPRSRQSIPSSPMGEIPEEPEDSLFAGWSGLPVGGRSRSAAVARDPLSPSDEPHLLPHLIPSRAEAVIPPTPPTSPTGKASFSALQALTSLSKPMPAPSPRVVLESGSARRISFRRTSFARDQSAPAPRRSSYVAQDDPGHGGWTLASQTALDQLAERLAHSALV